MGLAILDSEFNIKSVSLNLSHLSSKHTCQFSNYMKNMKRLFPHFKLAVVHEHQSGADMTLSSDVCKTKFHRQVEPGTLHGHHFLLLQTHSYLTHLH